LHAFLLGFFLGVATLANQVDLVVVVASALLNFTELLLVLGLCRRMLLAELLDDALAHRTLK